eukprot:CAMPEP_0180507484 /NCGR_PEP_ID=MMETSP1036_2-20121128/48629_1 /TAXON_ID=632150 /ORGANISM="Azadinium spinosum, Strain 3D9" /LENGTH=57 /DNA_ID=CAMNT_0022517659 /DNA_START=115 /DNA_END=284 /DNA_ORIENTATION=-
MRSTSHIMSLPAHTLLQSSPGLPKAHVPVPLQAGGGSVVTGGRGSVGAKVAGMTTTS